MGIYTTQTHVAATAREHKTTESNPSSHTGPMDFVDAYLDDVLPALAEERVPLPKLLFYVVDAKGKIMAALSLMQRKRASRFSSIG